MSSHKKIKNAEEAREETIQPKADFKKIYTEEERVPEGYLKLKDYFVNKDGKKYQVFYNPNKNTREEAKEAYVWQEVSE